MDNEQKFCQSCGMPLTPDFIGALRAMGSGVEVLKPLWLRQQLLEEAKEMVKRYSHK